MKIIDLAKKHEDYIISMRRYFHENPELSGKEWNTLATISGELDSMGIEHVEVEKGGIIAAIHGEKDNGRAVLLRADIDALPILESETNMKQKRTCISKNPGVMHACGHDTHPAMLLGAAKVLLEKRDEIEGTVYLCFERAEEDLGYVKGIMKYLDENNIKIDSAFGVHIGVSSETGKLILNETYMMAGMMRFDITIEGKGGHGSRPHQAISPIDAFVAIYNGLHTLRLNKISPFEPLTWSIGVIETGNGAYNAIPQTIRFKGTMRTFDRDGVGMVFYNEMRKLVDSVCETYGCKAVYNEYSLPRCGVVNDAESARFAKEVIGREIGAENIITKEPSMGGETFRFYQMVYTGVFAFLGARNEEKGCTGKAHNEKFDIDEDALYIGSACHAAYAIDFLKSDIDTSERQQKGGFKGCLRRYQRYDILKEIYDLDE